MTARPVLSLVAVVLLAGCVNASAPAPVELRGPGYGQTSPSAAARINPAGYSSSYTPPPGNAAPVNSIQVIPMGEPNDPYAQAAALPTSPATGLGANPMAGSGLPPPTFDTSVPSAPIAPIAATSGAWASPDQLGTGQFGWPVRGKLLSGFGKKPNGQANDGLNIQAPLGTPVFAARDGTVSYAGNELRSFGNMVLVKHEGGYFTVYAHLDQIGVTKDQAVRKGQPLGTVGQSGGMTEPQLHFEVRRGSTPQDPKKYLGS